MGPLTGAALLEIAAKKQLPRERVETPELGEGAYLLVQGMSGKQRDEWEQTLYRGRGQKRTFNGDNARARLAVRCLIDEDGSRLLKDSDAVALGDLRTDVLQRVFEVAQRLSGVSDKDADELDGTSEPAAGAGSPTN